MIYAIIDFILVGVIVYGMSSLAYAGYPSWVPYVLIIFFLGMAILRCYQFFSAVNAPEAEDND
jgi:hypothetical protein